LVVQLNSAPDKLPLNFSLMRKNRKFLFILKTVVSFIAKCVDVVDAAVKTSNLVLNIRNFKATTYFKDGIKVLVVIILEPKEPMQLD
jgi:hypothetical protein